MALDHQPAVPPAYISFHTEAKPAPMGSPRAPAHRGQQNISPEKSAPVQQLRNDTRAQAATVNERKMVAQGKSNASRAGWTKKDPSGKMPNFKAGTRARHVKHHLQVKEKPRAEKGVARVNWGSIKPQPKPAELVSIPKAELTPDRLTALIREIIALATALNTQATLDEIDRADEEARIGNFPNDTDVPAETLFELEAKYRDDIANANTAWEQEQRAAASSNETWAHAIALKNRFDF